MFLIGIADVLIQGLILQLEDSRAHKYYHYIDIKHNFLFGKITSQEIIPHRINLSYLKEMISFLVIAEASIFIVMAQSLMKRLFN